MESNNLINKSAGDKYKETECYSNEAKKCVHDIRNSTVFSIDILTKINKFSSKDRMTILVAYNDMVESYASIFDK